jgi:hypothetical protein
MCQHRKGPILGVAVQIKLAIDSHLTAADAALAASVGRGWHRCALDGDARTRCRRRRGYPGRSKRRRGWRRQRCILCRGHTRHIRRHDNSALATNGPNRPGDFRPER